MAVKDPLGILTSSANISGGNDPLGILKKKEKSGGEESTGGSQKPISQSPLQEENRIDFNDPFGIEESTIVVADKPVLINSIPAPFAGNKKEYVKSLQQRIDTKTYSPDDVNAVAQSMKVVPLAASAFMDNKPNTGVTIQFADVKNKYGKKLQETVLKANTDLGRSDDFASVFASAESVSAYMTTIDNLYSQKAENEFNKLNDTPENRAVAKKQLEPIPYLINNILGLEAEQGSNFIDKTLPRGAAIYNGIKEKNASTSNDIKSVLGYEIINRVTERDDLTKDEKVETISQLVNPRQYNNNKKAIAERLDPFNYVLNNAMGVDTENQIDILNSTKGHVELGVNAKIKENINYNNALAGSLVEELNEKLSQGLTDEKEIERYKNEINSVKDKNVPLLRDYEQPSKILEKYPTLFKESVIGKLNEYNAITSGNVKGQQKLNISRDEFLRNNGFDPNDQKVQDAINSGDLKDYSLFGKPATAVIDVFKNAGKSTLDIVGVRDDVDVLSEKQNSELFPTTVQPNDEYQLTGAASTLQNIANTTGQVIGQGLLQLGTANIGRLAGLSKVAAANTGFWSSGALTSYDQAYKDAYDFIDTDAGRTSYAGLIALSNAASEKIFPDVKLFQIPGVKDAAANIAGKIGKKEFTQELATEALGKLKSGFVDYAKKYAKNVGQETIEEVATDLFESGTRFLFGDPNVSVDSAIQSAKNTAIQTAVGTSFIAGFGARADMQREKNMSAKSTIYNAAIYHDEAMDAINTGFQEKLYDETERDLKIKMLNTARNAVSVLNQTEKVSGVELSRSQRELYVANLTAESLLNAQKGTNTESVLIKNIDSKISALREQREGMLEGKVQIDDNGNFITPPIISENENKTNDGQQPLVKAAIESYSVQPSSSTVSSENLDVKNKDGETWFNRGTKINDNGEFVAKDGKTYTVSHTINSRGTVIVKVKDGNGKTVASSYFDNNGDGSYSTAKGSKISSDIEGIGLAKSIYDYTDKNVGKIRKTETTTDGGENLWRNNKPNKPATVSSEVNKQLEGLVNQIPVTELRRPNGSIGTQGFVPENLVDVARHIAKEMGFAIPAHDKSLGTSEIKQVIDYLKSNKEAQDKIKEYVTKDPVVVQKLPDDSYSIEDGNHRANLLNLIGVDTIPTINLDGKKTQERVDEHNKSVEEILNKNKPIQNEEATPITFEDYNTKILSMAESMTDSSFDWRLSIPEMSQEQRQKAVEDIRNGKDSIAANKLKSVIQDWYDKGEIELNRGRGNNAERQTFPIEEWFAEPLSESELSAAEKMDDDLAKIISEEGITLDNIDNLKNIFNGFPYSQADFNNIKNFLSTQSQGNANSESNATEGNTKRTEGTKASATQSTQAGSTVKKEPKIGKYEKKAREIADSINKTELPSWLTPIKDPNIRTQGVTAESLKKALADAVVTVGKLLDAGTNIKDAIKQGADKIIDHILTDYPKGANLKADYEKQLREGFENYYNENAKEEPKSKSTKLTDVEKGVIQEVLNKPINAREFPTFFDMNQQGVQQTAKTQAEGQERPVFDGTYVKAHLEDLRSISLNNAKILQDSLGKNWKEKVISFFEESPNAGNIAQVSGLMNVINTDLYNEISKSKDGTQITALKDLQARADLITYDTSRSASLALNQRRMYQDFGQGNSIADILSNVILTPEQQATKAGVQAALKKKFTDEELNKKKPKNKKSKPATKTTKKSSKQDSSVKSDLVAKGQQAAQQTDADGNVITVSLKDKINQANDALKGFKC